MKIEMADENDFAIVGNAGFVKATVNWRADQIKTKQRESLWSKYYNPVLKTFILLGEVPS